MITLNYKYNVSGVFYELFSRSLGWNVNKSCVCVMLGWTLKRLFRVKTLADKTDRFWLIHVHVGLINTGKIFEEVFYRKTTTKSPVSTWCDGNWKRWLLFEKIKFLPLSRYKMLDIHGVAVSSLSLKSFFQPPLPHW